MIKDSVIRPYEKGNELSRIPVAEIADKILAALEEIYDASVNMEFIEDRNGPFSMALYWLRKKPESINIDDIARNNTSVQIILALLKRITAVLDANMLKTYPFTEKDYKGKR